MIERALLYLKRASDGRSVWLLPSIIHLSSPSGLSRTLVP